MTEKDKDFDPEKAAQRAVGVLDEDFQERPRGMLSHDDRLFVAGMKEFEWAQSESNARRRVIERVANGFQDFGLLRWLNGAEARSLVQEFGESELHRTVAHLITFVYQATDGDADAIESMVETGVLHGENTELGKGPQSARTVHPHTGGASNVDATIQIERNPEVERIYEQYQEESGESLTPTEIGILVREGRLDADDLQELHWYNAASDENES